MSIQDMLSSIEKQLGLETPPQTPLLTRLEKAETQTFGKKGEGNLNLRTKSLYSQLLSTTSNNPPQGEPLIQGSFTMGAEQHYLEDIFKTTEGRVIRWGRFPLRVYIEEPKENPQFKPEYMKAIEEGLAVWKQKTNGFVAYTVVKNRQAADVQITWDKTYTDRFSDLTVELPTDHYKNYSRPKPNPLVRVLSIASMFTPGPLGLAPQAVGAALQYKQLQQLQILIDESKITLGLDPIQGLSSEQACQILQNTVSHEFGHVLGIKGHSNQPEDLMYGSDFSKIKVPTPRDIETLRQLYSRPASVVLNVR